MEGEAPFKVLATTDDLDFILDQGYVAGHLIDTLVKTTMIDSLLLCSHLGLIRLNLLFHLLLDLIDLLLLLLVAKHHGGDVLLNHLLLRVIFGCNWAHTHSYRLLDATVDIQIELASCLRHHVRLLSRTSFI